MGGSSGGSKQIVGYRYYMGMHLVLCHGPVDDITELRMQGRTFWNGSVGGNNTQITINQPNLFGGEKREGGIAGAIDIELGGASQPVNGYLQTKMASGGVLPAFRGVVGMVLRKCYLAANNPYVKPISARVKRYLSGWDPAAANPFSSYLVRLDNGMNPAAILYACLTDTRWGMGYPPEMIESGSFWSSAWNLYSEQFGLNLLWTRQQPIEQFVQQVLDHIGGVMVVNSSGQFSLSLIREPDLWNARNFGRHNIIALESFERPDWSETVNELTITYTDQVSGKPKSLTVHNLANIEAQGGVVAERRDYPGITDDELAAKVALRDLRSLSVPLARIKLKINPRGDSMVSEQPLPGDVIVLDWPELGIANMVLRVGALDMGDQTDHSMTLTCVEDVFALGESAIIGDNDTGWVPDDNSAQAPVMSLAVEATWWDLAHTLSRGELSVVEDTDTYITALAVRDSQAQSEWRFYTGDDVGSAAYRNTAGYSPAARLAVDLQQAVDDVTVAVTDLADASLFSDCDYAWLVTTAGEAIEAVGVLTVDEAAGTVTLQRAVFDTVPVEHAAGTWLIGAGPSPGYDPTVRAPATQIGVWIEPHTVADVGSKTAVVGGPTIDLAGRQGLPFPPGNVQINGAHYPATIVGPIALIWSHRDRVQQTAYLVAQTDGDIGPEPGVTYRVRYYGETGTLLRTRDGITTTSDAWTEEATDSALPGGRLNGQIVVEVDAQRGALDSLHQHRITCDRAGYGYQYGNYYGGI